MLPTHLGAQQGETLRVPGLHGFDSQRQNEVSRHKGKSLWGIIPSLISHLTRLNHPDCLCWYVSVSVVSVYVCMCACVGVCLCVYVFNCRARYICIKQLNNETCGNVGVSVLGDQPIDETWLGLTSRLGRNPSQSDVLPQYIRAQSPGSLHPPDTGRNPRQTGCPFLRDNVLLFGSVGEQTDMPP